MALGWDQAVAHASIMEGIPFLAAVPFRGQERIWPLDAQRRYHSLLERAAEVDWGSEHPGTKALLDRNKWMMQRCDTVLALWNGSFHGGTAHAIAFATRKRLPIINLWSKFVGGNEWDDILG